LRVSDITREIREVDSEINGDFLGIAISVMGLADCANKASAQIHSMPYFGAVCDFVRRHWKSGIGWARVNQSPLPKAKEPEYAA